MATRRAHTGRFAAKNEATTAGAAHKRVQRRINARAKAVGVKASTARPKLHRIFQNRLDELDLDNRDAKTIARNRTSFERFTRWCDAQAIEPQDVSETDLRMYFMKYLPNHVASTTAATEAQHVKTAYRYAAEDGIIDRSPVTRRVKVPRAEHAEVEIYTHDELRLIRGALADNIEELAFYAFAYAGLRRHELAELERADVHLDKGYLLILGKGGKPRRVPLHPLLTRVLAAHLQRHSSPRVTGYGGSTRNLNAKWSKLLQRAGVDGGNRSVHRVRKTAATSLRREGVAPETIDRIFGWAPTTIRERYYNATADDEAREAILQLYRSDPIERPASVRWEAVA
jgi:integrase